jgi:DivIVA domain-containing protein
MARDITSEDIRNVEFRTVFRGLDRAEVEDALDVAARRLTELEAETAKLKAQIEEGPRQDLSSEFESVGREVSAILQSAREAAESMRERANLDAARWRSEAMEESETARKEAAADAEALRHDAWVTGTELLEQSMANAEAMRAAAERDVLTVMGEAEREAHRLTSGARREAEDLIRNANMEAEKTAADAAKRRDEIIDRANREAATAQERTRALELRRDELLEELENVRSTLTRLEGSLDERREALDLTQYQEPSNVRVVHPPSEAKEQWQLGETVRVVPQDGGTEPDGGLAEEVSDQVARMREPDPDRQLEPETHLEPEPETPLEPEPSPEREHRPEPEPEPHPQAEVTPEPAQDETSELLHRVAESDHIEPENEQPEDKDDLEALFASLRGGGDTVAATVRETGVPSQQPVDQDDDGDDAEEDGTDWIAVRDSRLLPITNRALRGVKKAMTEIQNQALDNLRTTDDWVPDESAIAESVHAELVAVWAESFAAGHVVAEQMGGERLKRPSTPASNADNEFASDLAKAVGSALESTGDGPRQRQSAASRVFRVWRSDEAERRIRDLAILGYELGIEKSRSVKTG